MTALYNHSPFCFAWFCFFLLLLGVSFFGFLFFFLRVELYYYFYLFLVCDVRFDVFNERINERKKNGSEKYSHYAFLYFFFLLNVWLCGMHLSIWTMFFFQFFFCLFLLNGMSIFISLPYIWLNSIDPFFNLNTLIMHTTHNIALFSSFHWMV